MKQTLVLLCLFTAAAGTWLGVMENVLKHDGYAGRSVTAVCIAIQAIITLYLLFLNGRPLFRSLVVMGAIGIGLLGTSALWKIGQASHFEGFVFLIGSALVLQGALTVAVLFQMPDSKTV